MVERIKRLEAALRRKEQDRPSREPVIDGRAEARLIALACSAPPRGRKAWTLRLEALLAAGDVAGALAALRWWLACGIAAGEVDESWTTRELLERCGRTDLLVYRRSEKA